MQARFLHVKRGAVITACTAVGRLWRGFRDLALLRAAVGAPLIAEFDQAQS
jgi:hypothetical protein